MFSLETKDTKYLDNCFIRLRISHCMCKNTGDFFIYSKRTRAYVGWKGLKVVIKVNKSCTLVFNSCHWSLKCAKFWERKIYQIMHIPWKWIHSKSKSMHRDETKSKWTYLQERNQFFFHWNGTLTAGGYIDCNLLQVSVNDYVELNEEKNTCRVSGIVNVSSYCFYSSIFMKL